MGNPNTIIVMGRTINIITGVGLIILGIFSIINILNFVTIQFFLIPSPIFIILFGIVLLAAEFKIKVILKNVPFLSSFLGRGIFNIYLSSIVFWFLENHIVPAWIAAMTLLITGILYIIFHMGWSKYIQEYYKQGISAGNDQKQQKNPVRENFF